MPQALYGGIGLGILVGLGGAVAVRCMRYTRSSIRGMMIRVIIMSRYHDEQVCYMRRKKRLARLVNRKYTPYGEEEAGVEIQNAD